MFILFISLINLHVAVATSLGVPPYVPANLILLNCGASSHASDISGRRWDGDEQSKYSPVGISTAHPATHMDTLPDRVPYETARIFRSENKYTFPFNLTGQKFLRLYFYPGTYPGFDTSNSFFTVVANGMTLLKNFSACLNSHNLSQSWIVKEFIIDVKGDYQEIQLSFLPNSNTFAFINGIEIISIPDELYFTDTLVQFAGRLQFRKRSDNPEKLVPMPDPVLETLYRVNVGGANVQIQDDTGMSRYWSKDDAYLRLNDGTTPHNESQAIRYTKTSPYSAPKIVYMTSRVNVNPIWSMDFEFPVDSGFQYMLRLHFCEIQLQVVNPKGKNFTISINEQPVENEANVISWTGGTGIPYIKDYITNIPDDGRRGKVNLSLSLYYNIERIEKIESNLPPRSSPSIGNQLPSYSSALLNGLEIFKLSDLNQSLAAANPEHISEFPPLKNKEKGAHSVYFRVVGSAIGALAAIGIVSFVIFKWQRTVRDSLTGMPSTVPGIQAWRPEASLLADLCRQFSLKEIKAATCNFDNNFLIGEGGFGKVYKGFIHSGSTAIAVKRLKATSNQGVQEFQTEIELLSKLRHLHLVSLIGYSNEQGEMILVYDYMARGTLRDHLYDSNNPPLPWKHRLQICLGAARGFEYLHTSTKHAIIHRDVKSTNILLDEKWVAKMSDFGLSKIVPSDASNTHISTAVKGSFGYMDPEYYKLRQLTEKSDVYSFGVVLFEVLCARPAILPKSLEPDDQVNLGEWAKLCYQEGTIHQIVDSNLKGQVASKCLNRFVETAIQCLSCNRSNRPSMSEVVRSLELAVQLQDAAESGDDEALGFADRSKSSNAGIQSSSVSGETSSSS